MLYVWDYFHAVGNGKHTFIHTNKTWLMKTVKSVLSVLYPTKHSNIGCKTEREYTTNTKIATRGTDSVFGKHSCRVFQSFHLKDDAILKKFKQESGLSIIPTELWKHSALIDRSWFTLTWDVQPLKKRLKQAGLKFTVEIILFTLSEEQTYRNRRYLAEQFDADCTSYCSIFTKIRLENWRYRPEKLRPLLLEVFQSMRRQKLPEKNFTAKLALTSVDNIHICRPTIPGCRYNFLSCSSHSHSPGFLDKTVSVGFLQLRRPKTQKGNAQSNVVP